LGEPFDKEKFEEILKNDVIPEYLEDITLNIQEGPRLRSENLPENSHILETTTDSDEIYEDNSILEDDDKYLEQLNYLHESNLLGNSNISYEKIPTLYRSAIEKGMDHDLEKEMEKIEKLKRQLFIGKVQEIIGFEKTIELLKECNETFKNIEL
jgi:hypothetical protein